MSRMRQELKGSFDLVMSMLHGKKEKIPRERFGILGMGDSLALNLAACKMEKNRHHLFRGY